MADTPQEVREAAAKLAAISELRPLLLSGEHDDHLYIEVCHAMLLAGKRAGMERAAEIVEQRAITQRALGKPEDWPEQGWNARQVGIVNALEHIAQAIRSENDGHG